MAPRLFAIPHQSKVDKALALFGAQILPIALANFRENNTTRYYPNLIWHGVPKTQGYLLLTLKHPAGFSKLMQFLFFHVPGRSLCVTVNLHPNCLISTRWPINSPWRCIRQSCFSSACDWLWPGAWCPCPSLPYSRNYGEWTKTKHLNLTNIRCQH